MSDDADRNLDALARRLADVDRAVDAALGDDPVAASLQVSPHRLSYDELTAFNDELRERSGWTGVDPEAGLTPEHREALAAWRERHRLRWTDRDLAIVGVAGLVGALSVWFDSSIDGGVRTGFGKLEATDRVSRWKKAGERLPIDFMGAGFGGRTHRIKSGGHDLLRVFSSLRSIVDGEFHGKRRESGRKVDFSEGGRFDEVDGWADAAGRLMRHLAADFLTPMSLPVPGTSWLYDSDDERVEQFALHAYSGLRAGEGWNLRSATVGPGFTALLTEVIVRTHVAAEAYEHTGALSAPTRAQRRKRTELLLAAHTLVGAVSLGKTAARLVAMPGAHGRPHPAAIRHLQLPTLIRAGHLAVGVVRDARSTDRYSARTWDELVVGSARVWQLDLPAVLEERCALDD
ncbi:hypothetical protein IU433_04485 [Nocardia puris]|uniref:hypothetical protein n=1 Tax=Nocardia puris TaxID=208602 RepID=UPI001894FD79|nr:hypothetical protein [Nocardia puris]MBF6209789.1 hypothetical protein [Nocardia puris]MBF6366361.1 hypothetical protein [Nocardia puris]MBF6458300.1 hypothetical protein [Nocardia puris]